MVTSSCTIIQRNTVLLVWTKKSVKKQVNFMIDISFNCNMILLRRIQNHELKELIWLDIMRFFHATREVNFCLLYLLNLEMGVALNSTISDLSLPKPNFSNIQQHLTLIVSHGNLYSHFTIISL